MSDIVVLDGYTLNPGDLSWDALCQLGNAQIYDETPSHQIVERIGNAPYVFTNKTNLTQEIFESCPNICFVGVLATGYNVVDIEAAQKRGIVVCNVPNYGTEAVAQMVFAHILEVCFHVSEHAKAVASGKWATCKGFSFWDYPLIELAGKTIGIIGFGKTGQATARLALAFGMKVLFYTRTRSATQEQENCHFAELDVLLQTSDFVSLHCPLTPQTQGMINKKTLSLMKKTAVLINTARGGLVVDEDLANALHSGQIFHAGLDVVSQEPIPNNNPLLQAKNCLITPHIAWAPKETRQRLMQIAISNLDSFLKGRPVNCVGEK